MPVPSLADRRVSHAVGLIDPTDEQCEAIGRLLRNYALAIKLVNEQQ